MQSSFPLQTPSFSSKLNEMQSRIQLSGQLFAQLGSLPLLFAELNQNGLSRPESLSMILPHFLNMPLSELRLSLTKPEQEKTVTFWEFHELEGQLEHRISLNEQEYGQLQVEALHMGNLQEEQNQSLSQMMHKIYGQPCHSLFNIPLSFKGQHIATLHLARSSHQTYTDKDFFLAQLLGQILTPILAGHQLQQQAQSLQLELEHIMDNFGELKQAKMLLEDTKRALVMSKEELAALQKKLDALETEKKAHVAKNKKQEEAMIPPQTEPSSKKMPPPPKSVLDINSLSNISRPLQKSSHPPENPSEYIASAPPLSPAVSVRSVPQKAEKKREKSAGLSLPPLESLRNAFLPEMLKPKASEPTQKPSPNITSPELLLVDIIEEEDEHQTSPSTEDAAALLEDMEWEQENVAKSQIACLSETPSSSLRSFARIIQAFDFVFQPASTIQHLLEIIDVNPIMAISLTSAQYKRGTKLQYYLQNVGVEKQLPLFEASDDHEFELSIRIHWNAYESSFIKDTFWHGWLQKTQNIEQRGGTLGIGFDPGLQPAAFENFFCGKETPIQVYENPVDGIQILYQQPPSLLLLRIGKEQELWLSLLPELSRSVRTLEVPILIIADHSLSKELKEALQPFMHLILAPSGGQL